MEWLKSVGINLVSTLLCISAFAQTKSGGAEADSIVQGIQGAGFFIFRHSWQIDSRYINFMRESDFDFCIADRGSKYNETDLHSGGLCNRRIVFYGRNKRDSSMNVLLYETDHGGGPGKSCDIFIVLNNRLKKIVAIDLNRKITSLRKLRLAIREKQYTIEDIRDIP